MLLEQFLNGLQAGLHYVLIALGFNLTLGVLRVANLAYGETMMGAGFAAVAAASAGAGPAVIAAVALTTAIVLGLVIHFIAVWPLGIVAELDSPRHLSAIVSTLGVSILLQNVAVLVFGAYPASFPRLWPTRPLLVSRAAVESGLVFDLIVCTVLAGLLTVLLKHSRFGLRIRAISENESLAKTVGISPSRNKVMTVGISSAVAGIAALLVFQSTGYVSPFSGAYYGLKAIIVVITAGMGNMRAVVVVGLALGMAEVLFAAYVSSDYRDVIAFILLAVFLVIRHESVPTLAVIR